MKYCTSSDFSAASASRTRAANASRGSGSLWMPVLPGFAVMPGAIDRPSRVPAVSVRAAVSRRSFGGGSEAQPVMNSSNATETAERMRFIRTAFATAGEADTLQRMMDCNVRLRTCADKSFPFGV
jgi:uncharacterized protein YgiB involved in biofilm formation